MQDGRKAVWSIPYVSVAFILSLKQIFFAYRSSKVSDYILEIHQLWQSGSSRVYSHCCCSCSFDSEILKIGQSSHKMYSNNILNSQESTTILNACTKKSWKFIECTSYIYVCVYMCECVYKYVHVCACVCVFACSYTSIHMQMHFDSFISMLITEKKNKL